MSVRKILLAGGLTAFVLLVALAQSGGTAPYRQRLPEGEVSWYEGWIRTRAEVPLTQGTPRAQALIEARRVALMKAQASALRLAMRVPVDSERRLEELEAVRVKVQGIVRGGEVLEEKSEGNKVSLVLQVPLAGVKGISSEVLTVVVPELATPPPAPQSAPQAQVAPQAGAAPPPSAAPKPKPRGLSTFAAVRIEAEESGAKPALCPKIVDPEGKPVYTAASVSPEVAKKKSIARYVSRTEATEAEAPPSLWGGTLPLAVTDPRRWLLAQQAPPPPPPPPPPAPAPAMEKMADAPPPFPFEEEDLVVTAVAAKGKLKADLVVTAADAAKLRANPSLLEDANVVVVVRTDVGGVESRKGSRASEFLLGRR